MMENYGISNQIDVSNMEEVRRPESLDCKVVEVTVDWKRKNPGYGAVRHLDSHKAVFATEEQSNFPKTIMHIKKDQITLNRNFQKLESRPQNLIYNETKGRPQNPVTPDKLHFNYA